MASCALGLLSHHMAASLLKSRQAFLLVYCQQITISCRSNCTVILLECVSLTRNFSCSLVRSLKVGMCHIVRLTFAACFHLLPSSEHSSVYFSPTLWSYFCNLKHGNVMFSIDKLRRNKPLHYLNTKPNYFKFF